MSAFQLQPVNNDTSQCQMIKFIQDAIDFANMNKATALSFNKMGSFIPKCRKGYNCDLVSSYHDELTLCWENSIKSNKTNRICRFRHQGEDHVEFYNRTGLRDTRTLRPFRAYIRLDPGMSPIHEHESIKWVSVLEWRIPDMGRRSKLRIGDLMRSECSFEMWGITDARRNLGVRSAYNHTTDSLKYLFDLSTDTAWFYFDPPHRQNPPQPQPQPQPQSEPQPEAHLEPSHNEFPALSSHISPKPSSTKAKILPSWSSIVTKPS